MGKSRIIMGNFSTSLSLTTHIRKLNIEDVSRFQNDVNWVHCQANNNSSFTELDRVTHECMWKKKGLRAQSQNIPDEKQEMRSAFSTEIKIIKPQ